MTQGHLEFLALCASDVVPIEELAGEFVSIFRV